MNQHALSVDAPTLSNPARPPRLRVLHLCAGNLFGGIEVVNRTLAQDRDLCPLMEPQFALCFEGQLTTELRAAGVPVHILGPVRFSRPWTVWRARAALRRVLERERPDVVVSHGCWQHALFASVVRSCGMPLVFWSHDCQSGRGWQAWLARRHLPNLVLANSRFTAASIPNLFPGVPVELLTYQIPPPPQRDRASVRRSLRAALGTPENAVVIAMTCRLEPYKGHTLLLEALAQLVDMPDWVCWIAGGVQRAKDEKYLSRLRAQALGAGLEGRVSWLGQRNDVSDLLLAADIHCQPNLRPEPFGLAFVEALYAGLPVVTTAMGGVLEIVDDTCGLLVPPGDVNALSGALRELITNTDLRASLGKNGAARAKDFCEPGKQINDLYCSLVPVMKGECLV